jgi:putative PIN family toxin of toxin-antitoxin system
MTRGEQLRAVFDTNVLVSAILFPQSAPGQALMLARRLGVLLASQELTEEIGAVLNRPKFDRYVTRDVRDEFLVTFIAEVELVEVAEQIDACRDPKDNKVLDVAANGRATCIISGDADLLVLHPFRSIPILSPADFLARYREEQA